LKDWINFGIYWKIYFRVLGLGLRSVALALALHVSVLGLDNSALGLSEETNGASQIFRDIGS